MKINKFYMNDAGGAGGGNGYSGVEKLFDYTQVSAAFESLKSEIAKITTSLSNPITVTSYQGNAQAEVEHAIDSIRVNLQAVQEPLTKMNEKIEEISNEYAAREADIKAKLSGIGSHGGGVGGPTNMTM